MTTATLDARKEARWVVTSEPYSEPAVWSESMPESTSNAADKQSECDSVTHDVTTPRACTESVTIAGRPAHSAWTTKYGRRIWTWACERCGLDFKPWGEEDVRCYACVQDMEWEAKQRQLARKLRNAKRLKPLGKALRAMGAGGYPRKGVRKKWSRKQHTARRLLRRLTDGREIESATCSACGREFLGYGATVCNHPVCDEEQRREHERKRVAAWRAQRKVTSATCVGCGDEFTPKRANQAYCGAACKQRAYRTRKAIEAAGFTPESEIGNEKQARRCERRACM